MTEIHTKMRRILMLFIVWLPVAQGSEQASINNLLDGFHAAAARSDFDGYFSHFTKDAYFLGTDAAERWSVDEFKTYAKPAFDRGQGWTYEVRARNLEGTPGTNVVWFDEILMNSRLGRCRGTGVVVREEGAWRIAHYSLTMLIPNEIAVEVGEQSMQADLSLN